MGLKTQMCLEPHLSFVPGVGVGVGGLVDVIFPIEYTLSLSKEKKNPIVSNKNIK